VPPAPPELNFHRGGRGEPLVLIHGIGSRWQVWLPVLERLEREREVIALDLPGFGLSSRPAAGTPAGPASLARMLCAFFDAHGLDRPHVAGNSLGGWIALELARRGRARSVTALSPAGFHTQAEGIFLLASLKLARAAARLARPDVARLMASERSRRIALFQLIGRPQRVPPFDAAESLRALADAPWFDETLDAIVRERFHGGAPLPVPVTIAWGEHDRLLLRRQAARAVHEVPNARLLTLMGCGHVPTYDDPDAVAGVLLDGSARA
jgi:pimeloyl-ACP methyl ester carboxylesterase